jgi:hypothetical protein
VGSVARFRMAAVALGVAAMFAPVHAAPAEVELSARVEPSEILVGEPIRYVITVTRPARARAELPAVRGNTGRLEVEGYRVTADTLADRRVRETHSLALTAWSPGDDTLPPQRVEIRGEGDTAALVLYTPPTAVAVRATRPQGTKEAGDIADIRDGERLPPGFPWGLPLLLAALAGLWYVLGLGGQKPEPVRRAARPVATPEETALVRLRELEEAGLTPREFAFALSEIVRAWLATRHGVDALEATTQELLERTHALPLPNGRKEWLRESCESLDRVKFAGATLSASDMARRVEEARAFVREALATPQGPGTIPNAGGPA